MVSTFIYFCGASGARVAKQYGRGLDHGLPIFDSFGVQLRRAQDLADYVEGYRCERYSTPRGERYGSR